MIIQAGLLKITSVFSLIKRKFLPLMDAFCKVWLKLAQWL